METGTKCSFFYSLSFIVSFVVSLLSFAVCFFLVVSFIKSNSISVLPYYCLIFCLCIVETPLLLAFAECISHTGFGIWLKMAVDDIYRDAIFIFLRAVYAVKEMKSHIEEVHFFQINLNYDVKVEFIKSRNNLLSGFYHRI